MKHLLMLWLVLGCTCACYSQSVLIIDRETKKPLSGVTLISQNPRESAFTNAEGRADISNFRGSETIQIRFLGYETITRSYAQMRESDFRIELEPATMSLNQVVISATKWRQSSGNVASKIASISAEEVALQNPQTAADLLGVSGKVFIQKSQQGGGSPMIRGFATNRLIYTVDGVRMNNAIFRGGNIQNVINLDPFATESTEVMFGPGSVIYGSDAIGGVMSFQTLTPELSLTDKPRVTGKAVTRYASANNEKTGHVDVNVGWKKWAVVTSFSAWDYDHLRQGSNGPADYVKDYHPERINETDALLTQDDPLLQVPSAYSQINLMQKVRFKPNENWDFQYGFHFSETSPYGRYDRHNRVRNGTARYAEWYYGPQSWMMNNLSITHSTANSAYDQVTLRLAHQSFGESRISRDFNADVRERRVEGVEAYSANLDFTKETGSRNTIYYGVEYILNNVDSRGTNEFIFDNVTKPDSITPGPSRYPNSTWMSAAVYVNNEFRMSDYLTFQGGLRYNQFVLESDFRNNAEFFPFPFAEAEINSGALTGSLGAVYRPNESWAIKANFGTAFRAPNVDDVGKVFDSEQGTVVVPNPGLRAEYARNFDLGIAKVFGNSVKVDVTGYYTILDNAMVRRDFQLSGQDSILYDGTLSQVQAIQNAAIATVYGVQAGIDVKLPAGFNFSTDLNYQVGEEELNDGTTSPSRHAPPFFGVSRLRYNHSKLTLEFNAVYQGERSHATLAIEERGKVEIYALDANGNTYAPAWYTLNLKALYKLSETFSISGGVENLTDQRYRPYSAGLSGAGRNFMLSLRADF